MPYRRELAKGSVEGVVAGMRQKDIRVQQVQIITSPRDHPSAAFTVSFRYPDRFKAQMVTRDLMAGIMKAYGGTDAVEVLVTRGTRAEPLMSAAATRGTTFREDRNGREVFALKRAIVFSELSGTGSRGVRGSGSLIGGAPLRHKA